jgi:hypothetical protein
MTYTGLASILFALVIQARHAADDSVIRVDLSSRLGRAKLESILLDSKSTTYFVKPQGKQKLSLLIWTATGENIALQSSNLTVIKSMTRKIGRPVRKAFGSVWVFPTSKQQVLAKKVTLCLGSGKSKQLEVIRMKG